MMKKKFQWVVIVLFGIIGITIILFYQPNDLKERLNFYNIINLVYLALVFFMGILAESFHASHSEFKILEVEAFIFVVFVSIKIINTGGELNRTQEQEIFNLNKNLKIEEYTRDSTNKNLQYENLELAIELKKRSKELEDEKIERLELKKIFRQE